MARIGILLLTLMLSPTALLAVEPSKDFAAGLAALAQRDFQRAGELFRRLADEDPHSHEALNNLAVAYAEQGREEEAAVELRAAIRLRPDYQRARDNLAAVYVRLATKELLEGARLAPPAQRAALLAKARALLDAGPRLAPVDLLAQADDLEQSRGVSVASPTRPSRAPDTRTKPATVPLASRTDVVLEPTGREALVIDVEQGICVRYRHAEEGLSKVGRWPVKVNGEVSADGVLVAGKRTRTAMHLLDLETRQRAKWQIVAGEDAGAAGGVVALTEEDYRDAIDSGDLPWLVLIGANKPQPRINAGLRDQLLARMESWRAAWTSRKADRYQAHYVEDFVDERGRSHDRWLVRKERIFDRSGPISIRLLNVVMLATDEVALTRFTQEYSSALEHSSSVKQLVWHLVRGDWRIAREEVLGSGSGPAKTE